MVLVAQFVPKVQTALGGQPDGPEEKEETQPAGKAGAVTASKFSFKAMTAHGTGVGVVGGVGVGGGGVGVEVGVGELCAGATEIGRVRKVVFPLLSVTVR